MTLCQGTCSGTSCSCPCLHSTEGLLTVAIVQDPRCQLPREDVHSCAIVRYARAAVALALGCDRLRPEIYGLHTGTQGTSALYCRAEKGLKYMKQATAAPVLYAASVRRVMPAQNCASLAASEGF